MEIFALKVTVQPYTRRDSQIELRIDIKPFPVEEHHIVKVIERDDLKSLFDQILYITGEKIKSDLQDDLPNPPPLGRV